jgi:hypothetical protein
MVAGMSSSPRTRGYNDATPMLYRKLTLVALLLPAFAFAADEPVTIDRKAPTTQTRTFDPKSPPPDVHLNGDEAAYTRSAFLCSAVVAYRVTAQKSDGPRSSATVQIESVKVELTLDNTLFLPKNATKKLIAHEQGHRQIAETIYQSGAEEAARRLASPLVGRTFTATGPDPDAAAAAASQAVMQKLCDDFMKTVPSRSATVNAIFDKLTDHGRNKLGEAEAIRRSFEQADGKPATMRQ